VSHDGRWVLFTSNWEKTLGTDPTGEAGTAARQDVFLVQLLTPGGTPASGPQPASSYPLMSIDTPRNATTVRQPFVLAGWAIDFASTSGSGVDAIHVWGYPNPGSGAPPRFIGALPYGGARADLSRAFGAQFLTGAFNAVVDGLPAGTWQFAVYAHSSLTGTFNNVQSVTVAIAGAPQMSIDTPAVNQDVTRNVVVAGWATDPNGSGSGVDAIHVWAYPNPGSGAAPVFVGVAGLGVPRPDVAAAFGPWGAVSGYGLMASLSPGVYDLVVFAHSNATGTFNQARSVRVTVR
jgi:hypothetical protein